MRLITVVTTWCSWVFCSCLQLQVRVRVRVGVRVRVRVRVSEGYLFVSSLALINIKRHES
jgi:hypothetical protein